MSRPVIGICSAIESARWAAWEVVVNLSPRTYSLAVQRAGGLALILPPDEAIELHDRSFAVGVLWHPEEDERSRVIGSLVKEARERMEAPAPRLREAGPPPVHPREAHG